MKALKLLIVKDADHGYRETFRSSVTCRVTMRDDGWAEVVKTGLKMCFPPRMIYGVVPA